MTEKDHLKYAEDTQLNRILKQVVDDFKRYADFQRYHLNKYAEIGMSMSGEDDTGKLLELIVFEAREITGADAGTLYMMDPERTCLRFVILQNDTMNTRMGGASGRAITLPPVPLFLADGENHSNVSSHVALTGEIVNIPDVYQSEEFDFTGPRKYDQATGYRSKSMLVIPLRNHENDIIGVLQLLNALDPDTREAMEFSDDSVSLVASLASQAAVAITKTELIQDLKELLDSFIKAIATAIDEKSPYTGGHISRVAALTMLIAERINEAPEGPFKDIRFTPEQMEELRVAAWLHDIGKITTPEFVVDKGTKLETIFDREQLVSLRFDFLAKAAETDFLRRKVACLEQGDPAGATVLEAGLKESLRVLGEEKEFVLSCNNPGEFMDDDKIARLHEIAGKTYTANGKPSPYLTENEVKNLCIRKGTLTNEERKVIENHASMTYKMLKELPFPKKMTMVPEIAGWHHEKLDGKGYPFGLQEKDIPLQARIVAVADVFEALTAGDRPYKRAMPLSKALQILGLMKKDRHIDPDVHDLFLQSGIVESYALSNLSASQIDMELAHAGPKPLVLAALGMEDAPGALVPAMRSWGVEVVEAGTAEECEQWLDRAREERPFDVVLAGGGLGDASGRFEAAAAMKRNRSHGLKAVLVLDQNHDTSCPARAEELGLDGCLPSPMDATTLKKALFAAFAAKAPPDNNDKDLVAEMPPGPRASRCGKARRVLIVDDSANTRMLLHFFLKHAGFVADTAENGSAGLAKFAAIAFDVVLMDLELPDMDGFAAVRAMRQWEGERGEPPTPVVALATHGYSEESDRPGESLFSHRLSKPIKKPELLSVIETLLQKHESIEKS